MYDYLLSIHIHITEIQTSIIKLTHVDVIQNELHCFVIFIDVDVEYGTH